MSQRGQDGNLPDGDARIDQLNRAVSLFVDKVEADLGVSLSFQPSSIPVMDVLLTEIHRGGRGLTPSLYLSIGGYVGETLIRSYGGRWYQEGDKLAVELEGEEHVFRLPIFDWVRQAYVDPHEDNLGERLRSVLGDGFHTPGDPGPR